MHWVQCARMITNICHSRSPWQKVNGRFDAAAEAAYPDLLTKRVASLVKRFWKIRAAPLYPDHCHGSKPWQYRINNTKSDQLIREFLTIQWIPLTQKLPPFQKLLHSFSKGDMPEEGINQEVPQGQHLVGAWHTPEQFVSKARGITHPMGENALDKIALDTVVNTDHRLLPRKEKEPSESKDQRKTDAQGWSQPPCQFARFSRKSGLWQENNPVEIAASRMRLRWYGGGGLHDQGVPLVGIHHHPNCYAVKIKPATLTEGELRESATFCRKALIARKPQTDEPGFAEHLEETAAEEVCIRGGGFRNNRSQPVEDHAPVCERARVQAEAYRWWAGGPTQCSLLLHNQARFARCWLRHCIGFAVRGMR